VEALPRAKLWDNRRPVMAWATKAELCRDAVVGGLKSHLTGKNNFNF
jgi:hypothetical protein